MFDAYIVDIDGTISNHDGQRGHYEYDKVSGDKPIWPVIEVVKSLMATTGFPIFVTGRMDEKNVRRDTENWIEQYIGLYPGTYPLFMRTEGDYRPDDIVKKEIYDTVIKDKYNVFLVLDDRTRVVNMWRSLGLQCFQVAPGDF